MKALAVSDVHIGYDKSDAGEFRKFLGKIMEMKDLNALVICGDLFDMWRRDIAGVLIENIDILQNLQELRSRGVDVIYVVGNHDYHLRMLKRPEYPFRFCSEWSLKAGGKNYQFKHGWEYEQAMKLSESSFEALCYFNDEIGNILSDYWERMTKFIFNFEKIMNKLRTELGMPAEERISEKYARQIFARVARETRKDEVMVFGHTHFPCALDDNDKGVVNLGSWIKDAAVHNTYLEVDDGQFNLRLFPTQQTVRKVKFNDIL